MRPVTRNTVVGLVVVVVALLALGALPSYLKSGDPYYVTAERTEEDGPSVNATDLLERHYPYVTGAVTAAESGDGRSDPYWEGPFGVKESFSHSPFDEFDAIGQRYPNATDDGTVYVARNGTRYRLEIVRGER